MKNTLGEMPADFDIICIPGTNGMIGLTSMPGYSHTKDGKIIDIDTQLARIKAWGAEIILSLVKEFEYSAPNFPSRVPEGLRHIELPIEDQGIPDGKWEKKWKMVGSDIRESLKNGGKICIHCFGGHGRTGTIAARILVEMGQTPAEAISLVRKVRPKCIENYKQFGHVMEQKAIT